MKRVTAVLVFLAFSTSCYSWQPVTDVAPEAAQTPSTMRLTFHNGSQIVIQDAALNAVNVWGWRGSPGARTVFHENRTQIQNIEQRRFDPLSTALLGASLIAIPIVITTTTGQRINVLCFIQC